MRGRIAGAGDDLQRRHGEVLITVLDQHQVERTIGQLLRIGVMVAFVVVLSGGVLYLLRHGQRTSDYHSFHGEPAKLTSVSGTIGGAFSDDPAAVIQLGLLLLIATPVARVIFSVFAFAMERDWLYVVVTLIVLAILLSSLMGLVQAR